MIRAMALREPRSAGELLPDFLAQLARSSGNAAHLRWLWQKVAGPGISKRSSPLSLEGEVLVIGVTERTWAVELRKHEAQLTQRLNSAASALRIARLEFREVACLP